MPSLKKISSGDRTFLPFLGWLVITFILAWGGVSWTEVGCYLVFPDAPGEKPYVVGLVGKLKCQVCGKVDVRDRVHDYVVRTKSGMAMLTCEDCKRKIERHLKAMEVARAKTQKRMEQVPPSDLGMEFGEKK